MDIDFFAHVEQTLNNFGDRIAALEKALLQLPDVEMEPDPSRPQVVVPAPGPKRP